MSRNGIGAFTLLLIGGLATGCASTAPTFATYDADGAVLEALVGGELKIEEGCLYAESLAGEKLLVFPEGSAEVTETGLEYGDETYRSGDTFTAVGGEVDDVPSMNIPQNCRASDPVVLVSAPVQS